MPLDFPPPRTRLRPIFPSIRLVTISRLLGNQRSISPLYELWWAREVANWQAVAHLSNQLDLPDEYVGQSHWSAMQLAHEATNVA